MTRDEAVTRMQRSLGFRTGLVTTLRDALVDAQSLLELEAFLPWFLLTEIASITTTANEERVPLPSNFLQEFEDGTLYFFDSSAAADEQYTPLAKDDIDFLRKELPGEGTEPLAYGMDDSYFRLFPTLTAAVTLKIIYYKEDTKLTSNLENKWLKYAHDVMRGKAGMEVAGDVRDDKAFAIFQKLHDEGMVRLIRQDEARRSANRRYVMGGTD